MIASTNSINRIILIFSYTYIR